MIGSGIWTLALTAVSIAVAHTLSGPDHYLPLVALSRAGRWSLRRSLWLTLLAGTSHVMGSLLLGLAGVALGLAVHRLEIIETWRADLAAFALIALGVLYAGWGLLRARRGEPHVHFHVLEDGTAHWHSHMQPHSRFGQHARECESTTGTRGAWWSLLAIFALGSCEPLVPILFYPASRASSAGLLLIATLYALATILTMMAAVLFGLYGTSRLHLPGLRRWSHALAGCAMALCGSAIVMWGL